MQNNIVPFDIASLLDGWIQAERNGTEFPVSFDLAWGIAGYSTKGNGKRKLVSAKSQLVEGLDYLIQSDKSTQEGRSSDSIQLTCDAFKQFCLLAETEEGRANRQYFIEAEKKWKLVKEIAPEVAQEVEILKIKRDIATQEAIAAVAQEKALALRHWVKTALEPADRDRVLGVTEIKTVEYRRTIVDNSGFVLNAGETLNKGQLCEKFGFVTRTGKPDYKAINALIEEAISNGVIKEPWREVRTLASLEFDAELLPKLKDYYEANPIQRQRWMGE